MRNILKLSAVALALCAASAQVGIAHAGQHAAGHDHSGHGSASEVKATTPAAELADGEIRKINKTTGKITVKHGEIKSVEMPPMTMVFGVADKAMLEDLKEGDKVKFNVKQEGSNYTVTEIKKAQ